ADSPGGARGSELSCSPADAPLVALLATDPSGKPIQDANAFVGRFPYGKLGVAALQSTLSRSGVDYQRDIKPLLGNPVALGAASGGGISGKRFLLAFVAKDAGKLAELATRKSKPESLGSYHGAKLSQSGHY